MGLGWESDAVGLPIPWQAINFIFTLGLVVRTGQRREGEAEQV